MNNEICSICNAVKRYDEYHKQYKRCDVCNRNHSLKLKYYYKNKDRILERLKQHRENNKDLVINRTKDRNSKYKKEINTLKDQIQLLTNRLDSISVS